MTNDTTPIHELSVPRNRAERRSRARRVAAAGSAAVLASTVGTAVVAFSGSVAGAAPTDVTNCDDSGAGSLRAAVLYSESHAGPDTITITAVCTASSPVDVSLGGEMEVTEDALTIVGPGADQFVLDGGDANRIFRVDTSGDFSLSGVTIQHGYSTDDGGGIAIDDAGTVTISGVVFDANESTDEGGALYIDSSTDVTITNSVFSNNSADEGGALYLLYNSGDTVISNSTFVGNTAYADGGAISIYEHPATFTLANSTVTGNTAGGRGAAIWGHGLYADGTFLFNTFADNEAPANDGLDFNYYDSTLTFIGNIFSSADGGDVIEVDPDQTVVSYNNDFHGVVVGFTPDATDLAVDPQLEPLADNGGPTPTRALAATSPVIDQGPTGWPSFAGDGFDQRGAPYARVAKGRADIGAYEVQPAPTPEPTPEPEPRFTG